MSHSTDPFDDVNFLDDLLGGEENSAHSRPKSRSSNRNAPDVEMSDLNSLADLFENEDSEWEQNWQEEIVQESASSDNNDWLNLDEKNSSANLPNSPVRKKTSEVSLAEDLNDLFGSEFSQNASPEPANLNLDDEFSDLLSETSSNNTVSNTDDISSLFGKDFSFDTLESPPANESLNQDFEELFDKESSEDSFTTLFSDNEVKPPESTSKKDSQSRSPQETTEPSSLTVAESSTSTPQSTTTSQRIGIDYYNTLEELELLINQPPAQSLAETNSSDIFTALESLIELPPSSAESPLLTDNGTATTAASVDDEFSELEQLLEQTDRTMGGPPTVKNAAGPVRQARARVSKNKTFDQTMRVPVKQLDTLSNLVGELVVNRNTLEGDQERLRQFLDNLLHQVQNLSDVGTRMQDLYERSLLESSLLASRRSYRVGSSDGMTHTSASHNTHNKGGVEYDPLEMDRFTNFHLLSQEMIELIVRVRESSSDIEFLVDETDQVARNLRQVTTQLQENLTKARMIPFGQTADRLPRAVREISLKLNKQAELQVEGRDTLIDKMILEHLYDPMTHLVNNAITHGIEPPDVRAAAGKAPTGRITIQAFHQGNQTVISVADDGAGINPERVKAKAIEKGLVSAYDSQTLSNIDIYDFLFHPGFSTKDKADDFAGRGVGMDVVRTSLSEIRGVVTIDSKLGKGTTFTIRLPLTLSICKALCCSSANARIAFPMDGVEDMLDIHPQEIQTDEDGMRSVLWRDSLLPCQPLSELLSYNRRVGRGSVYGNRSEENIISVVILRSVGNYLAVEVDQVLGEQEIVIKQVEGPIPKPAGIAGATILGDGRIMPIADVLELIEISQGRMRKDGGSGSLWQTTTQGRQRDGVSVKTEPMVLIVDDSITVRELLSMTFTKAGYRVEQARDGQEAWDKIRAGLPCDIVFCDIEMPRMDGLELLSRLQKDEQFQHLPVALLTSRGATRHRQMAADIGARGYFTKPYLEEVLLDAAQRMIRGEDLLGNRHHSITAKAEPKADNKVLIIDDSVVVRELLSATFVKAGYKVEQARDGQEAWDKLHSESFDLAFCDIEMPRMDGLELLLRLQQDSELVAPPIAMLTSRGAERHRQVAAERGASAYFTKPYLEDVLLEAAQSLINGEVLLENSTRAQIASH